MSTQENTQIQLVNQTLTAVTEMDGKYLTFWTDKQLFGIPIRDVVQIVGLQHITEIPDFPVYVKGIISLRGSMIPLIDVRLRFGKAEIEYNERTCIVVASIREKRIGFIVDEVNEVANIADEQVSPPPSISDDCQNAYLTGIAERDGQIILLLDAAKIFSDNIVNSLFANGGMEHV